MTLLEKIELIPDRILPKLQSKNKHVYFLWREVCHVFGSLIFVFLAYVISHGTQYDFSLIIFCGVLFWITYQEFYLHPKKYNQKLFKGIIDWLAWIAPFIIYFVIKN